MERVFITFFAGLGFIAVAMLGLLYKGGIPQAAPPDATVEQVTVEQASEAVTATTAPRPSEWQALEEAAAQGDAVAMNNLGVAQWRSRDGKREARQWFEKAAAAGNVQARYNFALMLPDKFDTDPDTIVQRLTLLGQNVELGDVPSMVALARSLNFTNRDAYIGNREGTIRSLLKRAAATGDPDYLFIYGDTLWTHLRGGADPALLAEALPALQAAFAAGEARGAETIGDILTNGNPAFDAQIAASGIEADPLLWYQRAGDMGLISARCHFALTLFRTGEWVKSPDMSLIERHFGAGPAVLGNSPERVQRALDDLGYCASNPARKRDPNPPFGEPSLYAYKLRGSWTAMVTSPGWANLTLGVLYGYGITVPRDRARAVSYLDIAADVHDFPLAKEVEKSLPDF